MAIKVGELAEIPHLGMRVHAGQAGLERVVTWAHVCDVENPWDALSPGEMLLSNGLGLPASGRGQRRFLEALDAAGVSALGIGEGLTAPLPTDELVATADRLSLPVLMIALQTRYSTIARTVAMASQGEEHWRLIRAIRIYDSARTAVDQGCGGGPDLLAYLGRHLGCRLHVLDARDGAPVLSGASDPGDDLRTAVVEASAARSGARWPIVRLQVDTPSLAVPVPGGGAEVVLVVEALRADMPDLFAIEHVATIAALEVQKVEADRELARRTGEELLADLMAGNLDVSVAAVKLAERGLDGDARVLAAETASIAEGEERAVGRALVRHGVPHLLRRDADALFVVCRAAESAVECVCAILADAAIGVSDVIRASTRLPDAANEARWALRVAIDEERPRVRYGEATPSFLPRTLAEAERTVDRLLGSVLRYDAEHGTELVDSLETFLRCNRSWQQASERHHIHRQTLVYRMRRVEELTGRDLGSVDDIAQLWLAVRARAMLGEPSPVS